MSRSAEFLLNQFNKRKLKNPRYSLRAFARDLDGNAGRISQYFSGERFLSLKVAKKIADSLKLDEADAEYFYHLVAADKAARKAPEYQVLKEDELALLVEWHHFAVLSLLSVRGFKSEPAWIADRLNIPEQLVSTSLEKLERLGMIKMENLKWVRSTGPVVTSTDVPNQFLRLAHKMKLQHIIDSMDHVAIEKRDLSTITLAIDERKVPQIKKAIAKFRRKIAKEYSVGVVNQVYTMCIELFPLSRNAE